MLKVLIVEDDFMVADCLEEILLAAGFQVCGITGNVTEAIFLGKRDTPDLAIIDFRLMDDEYGTKVGEALCESTDVTVLYVSGNPDDPRLCDAKGTACIAKPYSASSIVAALNVVSQGRSRGLAPADLPEGFRLLNT
jgi:DNA-binding response OmpR family regulator